MSSSLKNMDSRLKFDVVLISVCFTVIVSLYSCSGPEEFPEKLAIHPEEFINLELEHILKYSEIIQLEFHELAPLSEGGNVVYNELGFFISDFRKPTYHFDRSGKFIRSIGKIGKGPGEFTSASEIVVADDIIIFLDNHEPTRLLSYSISGEYLSAKKIFENEAGDFTINPKNGDLYFFSGGYSNLLHRVDPKTYEVKSSFLRNPEEPSRISFTTFFTSCDETVLFSNPQDRRIYEIDNDTVKLKYAFDFGPGNPDFATITPEQRNEAINHGQSWSIHTILENQEWIYIMFRQQNNELGGISEIHHLIVDRKTKEVYRLPGTLSKLELFFPAGFWLDESSNLIVPINPSFLMDHEIWDKYFRLKGLDFDVNGNWLIVTIPLNKIIKDS